MIRFNAAVFTVLLLFSPVMGQNPTPLNTLNVPSEVEVGTKVIAFCQCVVPEDGYVDFLWSAPGLETHQMGKQLCIWGKPGTYRISLTGIPWKTITVGDQTFDVKGGTPFQLEATIKITGKVEPEPDPPGPDPEPEPDPTNVPFPAPGLTVMIIYESQETGRLPVQQRLILQSQELTEWYRKNCYQDGEHIFVRQWDDDYTDSQLQNAPETLVTAFRETKKLADGELPYLGISDGKRGFHGPLPNSVDEMLELLKEFE